MLVMPRNLLATFVIISACLGCGGGSASAPETLPEPNPVSRSALQDQRILLAPIVVDTASGQAEDEPAIPFDSGAPVALHQAADLSRVASQGAGDLRSCVKKVQPLHESSEAALDLTLNLEIDAAGLVLGGATNPSGGESGLPAIADCLLSAARSWKFPGRSTPGTTVLIVVYQIRSAREPSLRPGKG